MKITKLTTYRVAPRWMFLKIETDAGVVGWGEPILMSAIAGIDQALWDIKGKALAVPVYQLLGGLVRDRMKTYCWVGGDRPADITAQIREHLDHGFDTFKLNACEELGVIDSSRAVDAAVAKIGR